MITLTPARRALLDELRAAGDEKADLGALVDLGARARLDSLRRADANVFEARRWLARRVLARQPTGDPVAADEVKRAGLIER